MQSRIRVVLSADFRTGLPGIACYNTHDIHRKIDVFLKNGTADTVRIHRHTVFFKMPYLVRIEPSRRDDLQILPSP